MLRSRVEPNRKVLPKCSGGRLRAALLASVAAVGLLTATPAEAGLFKAIVGGVSGFFTGGWGGAISGAIGGYASGGGAGGAGMMPPGCSPVSTGVIAPADKIRSFVYGEKLVAGGTPALGCPSVETIPGNVEIQATKTAVEAALQTVEAVSQTIHQAKMRSHSSLSLSRYLRNTAERFLELFGNGNVMPWSEEQVEIIWDEEYPEAIQFETPEDLTRLRESQERVARDASLESKRVSAALAQDINELSDRIDELDEARAACEGQTCVADINFQINAASAQLQAKTALMQSSHNRSQEAHTDMDREARTRAQAEWDRTTRRMEAYGGPGS